MAKSKFKRIFYIAVSILCIFALFCGIIININFHQKKAEKILADMSLYEKVCQLFIVSQEQITGVGTVIQSGETSKKAIEKYPVGGIIYFSKNLFSPEQTTTMIDNIQSFSKTPLFIAIDEEGGAVSRLSKAPEMKIEKIKPMGDIISEDDAYQTCKTIGNNIKKFGFNLNFAPVADVNSNPENPVIGNRAFSSDAETAAKYVAAATKGFKDSGVLCTLKHFPGHGDTKTDSHNGYTELKKSLSELETVEFLPFQSGSNAGADFVMLGHISLPEITGNDLPATFSEKVISLLREKIGFQGIIITDSLVMDAVTDRFSSAEAAVMAINAGVDVLLLPENLPEAIDALIDAVESGEISEERINQSVLKILNKKIEGKII